MIVLTIVLSFLRRFHHQILIRNQMKTIGGLKWYQHQHLGRKEMTKNYSFFLFRRETGRKNEGDRPIEVKKNKTTHGT